MILEPEESSLTFIFNFPKLIATWHRRTLMLSLINTWLPQFTMGNADAFEASAPVQNFDFFFLKKHSYSFWGKQEPQEESVNPGGHLWTIIKCIWYSMIRGSFATPTPLGALVIAHRSFASE
jgi:hypothetical protein